MRKRKPGRASAKRSGGRKDILPELLARELIGVCMATLRGHGLPGKRLAALARQAALDSGAPIHSTTAVLSEAHQLAELTNKWVEDPAYRDDTGRPAVLTVSARSGPCFARLARQFFPGLPVARVVAMACRQRVAERVRGGKIALINSTVLFTGSSLPILAYAIRSVKRFLRTADYNRRANASTLENWPDRTSYVTVSERDFNEFVRVFRPQISDLIESSNRWLSQRSPPGRRGRTLRVAGLQAFVFQE